MKEVTGNLWTWTLPNGTRPDVVVITTNGFVKKNGECVMGRGCALEAKTRFAAHGPDKDGISYPGIAKALGNVIQKYGNHVHELISKDARDPQYLLSFPVKHKWMEKADPILIERSARELALWADHEAGVNSIILPRPGCGNGQLSWNMVKPILEPILDDRFYVITPSDCPECGAETEVDGDYPYTTEYCLQCGWEEDIGYQYEDDDDE